MVRDVKKICIHGSNPQRVKNVYCKWIPADNEYDYL